MKWFFWSVFFLNCVAFVWNLTIALSLKSEKPTEDFILAMLGLAVIIFMWVNRHDNARS